MAQRVVFPWLKTDASALDRAIGIVEEARTRGLLKGTVVDALILRSDIVQAINIHATRGEKAIALLVEMGCRECGECKEWVHSDVWTDGRLSDGAVFCSKECREHAEPSCFVCKEVAREGERTCSAACDREEMRASRADAYRLARVEMAGVA